MLRRLSQLSRTEFSNRRLNRARTMPTPSTSWTDGLGDIQAIRLTPLLEIPVTIWVMQGPFATTQNKILNVDIPRAQTLYSSMKCGLEVPTTNAAVVINDSTNNPRTSSLIDADCSSAANLKTDIGFTDGQLNVYYLDKIGGFTGRGESCGATNQIIVSATYSDAESLAHEFGHAFSLVHPTQADGSALPGISTTNLMISGGTGRDNITTGQCFRINADPLSFVNQFRPGLPTRVCPPTDAAPPWCASVDFDVTSH